MKRISVIIPVYNAEKSIRKSIDSVLLQTLQPYEVIAIDDGSTDASGAILDEYADKYPQTVHVIHQQNRGVAGARNSGLDACNGDYISFVDADDYLDPEMYEILSKLLDEYSADAASIDMWVEQPDGQRYCRAKEGVRCCWNTKEALIELNSYRYLHISFCTMLIEKSRLDMLRFTDGQQSDDYALMYRVIAGCSRIAYSSIPLYHYVQTPNSCSRTKNISLAPMDISNAQLRYFEKNFPDIVWAAQTDCVFAHISISSAYARTKQQCPKKLMRELHSVACKYLPSVIRNKHLPTIKKLQAVTFCISPSIYAMIIARTEHR